VAKIISKNKAYAKLVQAIFLNLFSEIKRADRNKIGWLRGNVLKFANEDNLWFQFVDEYNLFDVNKLIKRIKELTNKKLEKLRFYDSLYN